MLGSPVFRENTGNLYMKGETDRAGRGCTDDSRFFDGSDPSPSRKVQQEKQTPTMEELVFSMLPEKVPVAKPRYIGHYSDARAIILGIPCNFSQDRQG